VVMAWQSRQRLGPPRRPHPTHRPLYRQLPALPPAQNSRAEIPRVYREQSCLHSQLWLALSARGDDFDGVCGVDGQLRAQQTVCEETVNAMDPTWGTLAPANPRQDIEQ